MQTATHVFDRCETVPVTCSRNFAHLSLKTLTCPCKRTYQSDLVCLYSWSFSCLKLLQLYMIVQAPLGSQKALHILICEWILCYSLYHTMLLGSHMFNHTHHISPIPRLLPSFLAAYLVLVVVVHEIGMMFGGWTVTATVTVGDVECIHVFFEEIRVWCVTVLFLGYILLLKSQSDA